MNKKHNSKISKHKSEFEKHNVEFLKHKRVSVVVPNYNYGKYIRKRMASILKQTYPIYEIIVLDDCSTDGSDEVLKNMVLDLKLREPEMRIRFVANEKNSGKAMAQWRKGFELAEGEFVWIAEADDLCSPKFLEEAMKGFDDPEVVLSYTESRVINGAGLIIAPNFRFSRDREKQGHYNRDYVLDGVREIEEMMAIRCTIPNVSAVVFRKKFQKDGDIPYGKYLKEALKYKQVGDWDFYAKVLGNGKIAYNRKALNYFRVHRGSVTGKSKGGAGHYEEVMEMHKKFRKEYKLSEKVLKFMEAEEERIKGRMK